MTASAPPDVLTPEHRHQLEVDSAILPEIVAEEDIRSLPSSLGLPTPDAALRHPNTHKGQYFGQWGETDKQFRPIDLGGGIWFGTQDVKGRLSGQYKPNRPRTAFNGHTVKYEGCRGTRPSFAIPTRCLRALVETMTEVFFTEGYKKALALASAGACAISLAGVDSWLVKPSPNEPGEPVEDFGVVRWHGRIVWIVYDSDAVLKDGVQWAERRLKKELESRGAVVVVLRVPHAADGSKRGVDDYIRDRLAAGVSRADALCELKGPAIAELIRKAEARRRSAATGSDGASTCEGTCPTAETLRAENHLLVRGPVPAQEAVFYRHLVQQADLARVKGNDRVKLYLPKDSERANVGRSTATRALNKLRTADTATLPFTVDDPWRGGKQHVDIIIPKTIGDEPWSPRLAYKALSRARLVEERKKQGGSEEAARARWGCPDHPDGATVQTTTKHYRCAEDDCHHSWSPPSTVVRHRGKSDPVQVEPGHDDRAAADKVEMYGATFGTIAGADPVQVEPSSLREEAIQVEPSAPTGFRPRFVSEDDLELFDTPHYQGEAPPEAPEPPVGQPPPLAPRHHIAPGFRRRTYVPPATPNPFTPSSEWQEIPDGYPCPPGGEFRMDFQTGKNWARWREQVQAVAGGSDE